MGTEPLCWDKRLACSADVYLLAGSLSSEASGFLAHLSLLYLFMVANGDLWARERVGVHLACLFNLS